MSDINASSLYNALSGFSKPTTEVLDTMTNEELELALNHAKGLESQTAMYVVDLIEGEQLVRSLKNMPKLKAPHTLKWGERAFDENGNSNFPR